MAKWFERSHIGIDQIRARLHQHHFTIAGDTDRAISSYIETKANAFTQKVEIVQPHHP
jgi:hypothetical protein